MENSNKLILIAVLTVTLVVGFAAAALVDTPIIEAKDHKIGFKGCDPGSQGFASSNSKCNKPIT